MKKMECGLCAGSRWKNGSVGSDGVSSNCRQYTMDAGRMNSISHILFRKTDMLHIQRNDFCTGDILSLLERTERRQK